MGASEQTVKGWGSSKRPGVDEIGCRELRIEPHESGKGGQCQPDIGEAGVESAGGRGGAELVGSFPDGMSPGKRTQD